MRQREIDSSTVNVDISACLNFRRFDKKGNFAMIYIFYIIASLWFDKSYFPPCMFFRGYLRNMNYAKLCKERNFLCSQFAAAGG